MAGLHLNSEKCEFFSKEIEIMGHIWSKKGIQNSLHKLDAIQHMSLPAEKAGLRSFLGLAAYLDQHYVAHYSSLVKPYGTCSRTARQIWHGAMTINSHSTKCAPCYVKPRFWPISTSTSLLTYKLMRANKVSVWCFFKITPLSPSCCEPWPIHRSTIADQAEFIAIVFRLTRLRKYILGTKFSLMTDHKPIVQLMAKLINSLLNRLQVGWCPPNISCLWSNISKAGKTF